MSEPLATSPREPFAPYQNAWQTVTSDTPCPARLERYLRSGGTVDRRAAAGLAADAVEGAQCNPEAYVAFFETTCLRAPELLGWLERCAGESPLPQRTLHDLPEADARRAYLVLEQLDRRLDRQLSVALYAGIPAIILTLAGLTLALGQQASRYGLLGAGGGFLLYRAGRMILGKRNWRRRIKPTLIGLACQYGLDPLAAISLFPRLADYAPSVHADGTAGAIAMLHVAGMDPEVVDELRRANPPAPVEAAPQSKPSPVLGFFGLAGIAEAMDAPQPIPPTLDELQADMDDDQRESIRQRQAFSTRDLVLLIGVIAIMVLGGIAAIIFASAP